MSLNNQNYFSVESTVKYMSASQFKAFMECEEKALAEIRGAYVRENSTALLVGSYVDAYFEGTLEQFKVAHPEIFLKSGELKADYKQANEIISRITLDEMFMKYMSGEKQVIFTGNIAGVDFKGKLDSYHVDRCIVDLKVMRDFEPIWKNHKKLNFVEAWGYDIQGAIYQELVFQNIGKKLPFFICAVTKEKVPDMAIISIPQERLDYCLEIVKENAPKFQMIKNGETSPNRCEKCEYCKSSKKITEITDYRDITPELFKETEPQTVTVSEITEPKETKSQKHKVKVKKTSKNGKEITINLNIGGLINAD